MNKPVTDARVTAGAVISWEDPAATVEDCKTRCEQEECVGFDYRTDNKRCRTFSKITDIVHYYTDISNVYYCEEGI